MSYLLHGLYALPVVYGLVGLALVRRARRPTCRVCLHREQCPIRRASMADDSVKRCYEQDLS